MIRRLTVRWLRPRRTPAGVGPPVRVLAVSDEIDTALHFERNRTELKPIDLVLGCGDLEPDYLCYLADAFRVPLLYVRGNHDRGAAWEHGKTSLPGELDGRVQSVAGVAVGGLSWPGDTDGRASRDEVAAWQQAVGMFLRARLGRQPTIMLSHVPPLGAGDVPEDGYHRGFAAYRWLCRRLQPRIWLHGHTPRAAAGEWHVTFGRTKLVNVTGAVLIELEATADATSLTRREVIPAGGYRR